MDGDGDFRSKEVTELRNEADFILTHPPFSLCREFLAWIVEAGKKFAVIGNMNAITYKEVFPLIKDNKVWLGATGNGNDMVFGVPDGAKVDEKDKAKAARLGYVGNYTRLGNSCWFTSIEHGRRHEPLPLMSMADNLRFSKHKELKGKAAYDRYDNYDAIEVPFTDAIPSDYDGVMGVPISFLIKYCPEQFEILSSTIKGIFSQRDYFSKDIASENNIGYKVLHKGDIVLSPQNLWMGNINYNDKFNFGIVSPSYKIFAISEEFDCHYVAFLLKTHRLLYSYRSISEQGASIVRRNLNMDAFLELTFKIPPFVAQRRIGQALSKLNDKIEMERDCLNMLKAQKQYLLSNLFI